MSNLLGLFIQLCSHVFQLKCDSCLSFFTYFLLELSRCFLYPSSDLFLYPVFFLRYLRFPFLSFHLRRDSRWSIAYSEELISSTISVTLQSTDRHHGIVGQERCHNQRDS